MYARERTGKTARKRTCNALLMHLRSRQAPKSHGGGFFRRAFTFLFSFHSHDMRYIMGP
ncbi:hypothetical protein EDC90_1001242 [Martelella mediterranea]|uniref:Uncharacterized protein n=1 Tax=Martelella mediterranea TaxID=293089 RepID=A0A4V2V508_9HYPH|nr:hypothetical protein EDC90_1001242 [Martelella mediterranea]